MSPPSASNPRLRRFWFSVPHALGIGVTAYSLSEARQLAEEVAKEMGWAEPGSVLEDVDVRDLDQGHVIPNMGPPNLRGVWFPWR